MALPPTLPRQLTLVDSAAGLGQRGEFLLPGGRRCTACHRALWAGCCYVWSIWPMAPPPLICTPNPDRELKKATRELHTQTVKMNDLQKIEHLTKRCSDLLHDMKKHERDSIKNKKRADQLQKEKDQSRTELTKTVGLKEKLEKLCRELQKENNKLKVPSPPGGLRSSRAADPEPEREQESQGQPSEQPELVGSHVRHASAEAGRLPRGEGRAAAGSSRRGAGAAVSGGSPVRPPPSPRPVLTLA